MLLFVGACAIIYHIFLADYVQEWNESRTKKTVAKNSVNKIAVVKMLSNDAKDIEKFVSDNAQYLTDDLVKKLAERIEIINCDKVLYEDSLKNRIDNVAYSIEDDDIDVPVSKKTKKR